MVWLGATAIAVGWLLALGGCGSGSEGSVLTKKQYVRRANAICSRFSQKLVRESEAFSKEHELNAAAPDQHEREQIILGVLLPNIEERLHALKTLPVPKGDEAKVAQIFGTLESGLRESRSHPVRSAAPIAHRGEPFREAMDVADDYGIWLCGQAGG
ncbi:MAG: hypothetical protein ACTHNP_05625 [Solirubrobacterales bacterium]